MSSDSLGRQSTVVFGGLATSIALGVALQSYLANQLGTSPQADVFYLGTAIPTLIATATLGSSSNALIRYATESPRILDPRTPRSPGRVLVLLAAGLSVLLALLGAALLGGVVSFGPQGSTAELGTFFLVVAIVPLLISLTALGSVLALANHDFLRAAWGGAANGLGLLVATVGLSALGDLTAAKLAVAVVIGYVVQLAFVGSAFKRHGGERETSTLVDPGVARAAITGVLVLIGASLIYKSQPLVERAVGASLGTGIPAALGYTDKITMALSQLATYGFAMAALPSLSRDLAASNHAGASARLRATLVGTAVSTAIVVAFALSSSHDIVNVLYAHGNFSDASADLTHSLVLLSLPSVVFGALAGPLVAATYANKRVKDVARIGIIGFVAGTTSTIALAVAIGAEGIVLGTAVGFATTLALFMLTVPQSLPEWSWRDLGRTHAPEVLASAIAIGLAWLVCTQISTPDGTVPTLGVLGVRLLLVAAAGFGTLLLVRRTFDRRPSSSPNDPVAE